MLAGAMTAYTSAAAYVNSAVGLAPALVASGLFLVWALEAVETPDARRLVDASLAVAPEVEAARSLSPGSTGAATPSLALIVLCAIVGMTIGFQFQFQQRDVPYSSLTSRFDSGPWWGIKITPERRHLMDGFAADLKAQSRPDDGFLIMYEGCGYYLYWTGVIAANSYWVVADPATGQLPQTTISYFRRHRLVPSLVVHFLPTAGMSDAQIQAASGGLDYPPTLVRPLYAFQRKPSDESTAQVLARLPRR